MRLLALDVGSSSVKAAVLSSGSTRARTVRVAFATRFQEHNGAPIAEVKAAAVERAIRAAIAQIGPATKRADLIAATTMSPSWLAMDAAGRALTPIVTHQDRRSVREAAEIERAVGKARHLALAGNRPFPGGISSSTAAWFVRHERATIKRAALVGHLGTWLTLALTGERVIDLSNAGFTGLMEIDSRQWSDVLVDAVGLPRPLLPRIVEADAIVGKVTAKAARRFGITAGTPVLAGCIDGSAAMLAADAKLGQLVNVCGSTDVLALCTDSARPHDGLLTRPLGVDGKWLSVATIAAAGSAIEWMHRTFFGEMKPAAFYRHVVKCAATTVDEFITFEPLLAGSRTSMNVARATLAGLTLGTTRDDVLRALLANLRRTSADRIAQFKAIGVPMRPTVFSTGGGATLAAKVLRSDWPKRFRYRNEDEATLRGLQALADRVK